MITKYQTQTFIGIFYLRFIFKENQYKSGLFTTFQISVQECNGFIHSMLANKNTCLFCFLLKFCWNLYWKQNSKTKDKPKYKVHFYNSSLTLVDEASNFILRHLEFYPPTPILFKHQENAFTEFIAT